MSRKRPPYPHEFHAQRVELVRAGRTPEELSREFEPTAQSIRNWVAAADLAEGRRTEILTGREHEELKRPHEIRHTNTEVSAWPGSGRG